MGGGHSSCLPPTFMLCFERMLSRLALLYYKVGVSRVDIDFRKIGR